MYFSAILGAFGVLLITGDFVANAIGSSLSSGCSFGFAMIGCVSVATAIAVRAGEKSGEL